MLPAVNLVYDLSDNQLVRFGVSQVIARPNTSSEANWVSLFDSTLGGVGGNTALKPYESTNTDLDYEYYYAKNSYLAVDLFYKDISNYIINAATPEQWTDYTLPGAPLQTYEITRPTNGGAATSEGAAISLPAGAPELPTAARQANYTRLHTYERHRALRCPSRSSEPDQPQPLLPENQPGGLLRLTYAWRDRTTPRPSFNGTSSTVTTAPYTELDANAPDSTSRKNISLIFAAHTNLLDETYRQSYETPGSPSLFADAYKFGRTYSASLHRRSIEAVTAGLPSSRDSLRASTRCAIISGRRPSW